MSSRHFPSASGPPAQISSSPSTFRRCAFSGPMRIPQIVSPLARAIKPRFVPLRSQKPHGGEGQEEGKANNPPSSSAAPNGLHSSEGGCQQEGLPGKEAESAVAKAGTTAGDKASTWPRALQFPLQLAANPVNAHVLEKQVRPACWGYPGRCVPAVHPVLSELDMGFPHTFLPSSHRPAHGGGARRSSLVSHWIRRRRMNHRRSNCGKRCRETAGSWYGLGY